MYFWLARSSQKCACSPPPFCVVGCLPVLTRLLRPSPNVSCTGAIMGRHGLAWQGEVGRRRGMTVTELLAVIAIVGLLASLTLVAVQQARESSRRLGCSANLRQIGLAVANYESQYRCFPHGAVQGYGYSVAILGFLEQASLMEKRDLAVSPYDEWELSGTELPIWRCPSESSPRSFQFGSLSQRRASTNYFGNFGTWWPLYGMDGVFRYDSGTHGGSPHADPVRASDISGGLSNTSLVAEARSSDGSGGRLTVSWELPRSFSASEIDVFAEYCNTLPARPAQAGWRGDMRGRGLPWTLGNMAVTFYDHVATPNLPSCLNRTSLSDAISTASSNHLGGVNVVACDGHVAFVANSVDLRVWRASGSRGADSN